MALPPDYKPVFERMGGAMETAFKVVKPVARTGIEEGWRAAKAVGRGIYYGTPHAMRFGAWHASRAARTILNYPRLTLGLSLAAGAFAMASDAFGGPEESQMNEEEMAAYARAQRSPSTGFAPGMGATRNAFVFNQFQNGPGATREAFIQSTDGLTLGLHRGRHR